MKISPVPSSLSPGVDGQAARIESIRSLKMNVNQTPGPKGPTEIAQDIATPDDTVNNEETPKATVESTEPLSPQFAALAKQRRALQQERRAFEDERKAFDVAKSQGGDSVPKSRIQTETLKVLEEAGVTYDMLTEAIMAGGGNSEIAALKAEIAALKGDVTKQFSDRESQAEQAVLSEMTKEANNIVASGDDFEFVRETRSVPDAIRLIEGVYRDSGEVMDVREALGLVEEELFNRQQKLAGLKKMQSLFKPAEQPAQQRPQGMRTLTNKDTASVPMSAKQRAVAAFYGQLKK